MDNERALFGLCGDQFGPKPFCFWTGCYPSAPLEATSHTSHNPIHGNKYVQSCSSEWLLICQIGLFYCQRNCLVSRNGYWPTLLTSRERNWASVKTTHPLSERHKHNFFLFLLNQTICSPPWCSQLTLLSKKHLSLLLSSQYSSMGTTKDYKLSESFYTFS